MCTYLIYCEFVLCTFIVSHLRERVTQDGIENYYTKK